MGKKMFISVQLANASDKKMHSGTKEVHNIIVARGHPYCQIAPYCQIWT